MNRVYQLLDHHHGPCVRDIDCNPNRPYYFVSCGDDCSAQFWDWRKLERTTPHLSGPLPLGVVCEVQHFV